MFTTRNLKTIFASLLVPLAVGTSLSVCSAIAKADNDDPNIPDWEAGVGAGGYFFEGNQMYDPGGLYRVSAMHNFDPTWSAEGYMGGMPLLNDNPSSGIVPPPADRDSWGLQWGLDFGYHVNNDSNARTWDPYWALGGGLEWFKNEIEGRETHLYADTGPGLGYHFNDSWSLRGDYRVAFVNGDDNKWNQMALVTVGYAWGGNGRGAEGQGEESKEASSKIDNREIGLQTVYFDFDKSNLREDAKQGLRNNADWMKAHPRETVIVEGHCDERGTNEYNMALGARRAKSAYDYLRSLGIPASQLSTVSYGEERPADPGHNETAWAKNRRVECRGR